MKKKEDALFKKVLTIKIRTDYYMDILGKEISDVLLTEYDYILREAENMEVPEDEYNAYLLLVERFKNMYYRSHVPAKRYMEKNVKKFATKFGLKMDLMPYFYNAYFARYPNPGETFIDIVFQLAIEFVALMLLLKKEKNK
jgi:hypothetical protein